MQMIFRLTIFILFSTHYLYAEIKLDDTKKEIIVLNKSKIYFDKSKKKTITTLLKQPNLFTSYKKEFINNGFCDYPIWVKFTIYNSSSKTLQRTLSIDELQVENVKLFTIKNNKVIDTQQAGFLHRKKFNGIVMHNFDIEILPHDTQTFYLKAYSYSFPLIFKAVITTKEEFIFKDIKNQIIWFFFTSVLITILIYNLLLFLFTKNSIYFYYSLYLCGILTQFRGIPWLYIFPMDDSAFVLKDLDMLVYYTIFISITMILFVQSFLQTKQYPNLHKLLNIMLIVVFIIIFILVVIPTFLTSQDIAAFYFFLFIFFFFVGFYALYKKNKNAPYFIFGWGFAIFAWLSLVLQTINIWSSKYDYYYIFETLIILEVFLFSYAIAKYIKELSDDKEQLSQKLVDQKENENIRLENEVKEKTAYLSSELEKNSFLLQELNHRVKNNMQFITSLYTLKLENSDSSNIHEKLQDVERKVQAMSQVHQMLYTQKNLKHIGADDYFEKIIQNIKASFDLEHVSFIYDIKTTLELEEAIYCGLIVNELVTNALKYAFAQNKGEIVISLREDETLKYLKVQDNGIGMTQGDTSGFGQTLIETLAIEQLDGEIYTDTTNGTKIEISFPKK
jgi:two-component sensor histidine kinase